MTSKKFVPAKDIVKDLRGELRTYGRESFMPSKPQLFAQVSISCHKNISAMDFHPSFKAQLVREDCWNEEPGMVADSRSKELKENAAFAVELDKNNVSLSSEPNPSLNTGHSQVDNLPTFSDHISPSHTLPL
ncbi:unnamed protein product [Allacma fusca]|uniref:Uncharacterized protein n=1 Tax=Allacma fusca TaxID=39272 RepID=A0A8J2JZQ1_9HEXA|nr:unnamed protein product [Allacma fusca]